MKQCLCWILLVLLLCGCGPKSLESSGDTLQPVSPLLTQSITAGKPASLDLPTQLAGTSVCRLKMLPLTAAVQRKPGQACLYQLLLEHNHYPVLL